MDIWQVRKQAIVERIPKDPRYPYSRVLESWDAQNYDAGLMIAFDTAEKMWKIWQHCKGWTEDYKGPFKFMGLGTYMTNFQSVQIINV